MTGSLAEILHGGPVDAEEVSRVRDVLVFEGAQLRAKFVRFVCLLVLAAGIATFGLLGDSVAVVIGAMIVAPLMLPIMGLAYSVSIGDRGAILSTLLVSLAGIVIAVAVGFVLTLPIARVTNPEAIQQVMIRTSPHLLDLMAALATGLAGAFALSRKDISDTLPGVAILFATTRWSLVSESGMTMRTPAARAIATARRRAPASNGDTAAFGNPITTKTSAPVSRMAT